MQFHNSFSLVFVSTTTKDPTTKRFWQSKPHNRCQGKPLTCQLFFFVVAYCCLVVRCTLLSSFSCCKVNLICILYCYHLFSCCCEMDSAWRHANFFRLKWNVLEIVAFRQWKQKCYNWKYGRSEITKQMNAADNEPRYRYQIIRSVMLCISSIIWIWIWVKKWDQHPTILVVERGCK